MININKKKILLIMMLSLGVILITTGIVLTINSKSNSEKQESFIKQKFNDLINAESYKVTLKETMKNNNLDEYYLNEEINYSIHFKENYESIETDFVNNNYYNYKEKQILAIETSNQEVKWYYSKKDYYEKTYDYKTLFLNLLKNLSNEEYQLVNNNYVNNSKNIDEHINKIYSLGTGTQKLEDDTRIKFNYVVDNVEISLNEDTISTITFNINQSCKVEYPQDCTKTKKIILTFNELNKISPTLPETVQKSLEKTTAGSWVGTYCYQEITEQTAEEKILILTDEFSDFDGLGWKIEYLSTNEDNDNFELYYNEGDKIYMIDHNGTIIEQGHIYEDKIELLDKNGKVKETYIKQ